MATLSEWIEGARPRTLPVAVAPVAVGSGSAHVLGGFNAAYAVLALLVSLFLQIGTNYANDYSDGIRGTDEVRVGPVRLVGQRLATPANVKFAAFASFGAAALTGLALIALSGAWWFLLIGVACIIAAWKYTGGNNPYGYLGLGEIFVFVFFGLVATLGTTYTQAGRVDLVTWAGAVGVGAIACAILVANNLRDIPSDLEVGKHTLSVRIGDRNSRYFYVALLVIAAICVLICGARHPWALLGLLGLAPAVPAVITTLKGAVGRDLIPVLARTGITSGTYGVLLGLGLFLA
ncbi:1,4-dihydroxy-2-naphthoate polyprenyltransferase [Branchiibius sp. NY16-3462-2]|uniref:1,4-dihydroxy-2-naphthoate polyprenyltransferase n=1 Tax=Branchiibius sp. NY16-3462-2 TaxID=1807500 RepID=UPI000792CCE7|nr:1,4-dihydroxy-2-naphthoate polyprenyltransferase [Branchiibius sp. NY16-3462-2]KYH46211.1 1,4-dihydroxy-2-naphthoate polyprenyltransferase [Branchiibius sp. NY16-3462-2]